MDISFTQSDIDECVFYYGKTAFLCYVDDGMSASPNQEDIYKAIMDLRNVNFDKENEGSMKAYLGMTIENDLMDK
eukprot:8763905-Ditylum_brightwellii.AAC.1